MRVLALLPLLLGVSARADAPLDDLLQRLGEAEERKLAVPACRTVESSVTEELDKEGKVTGRLTRSYEVTRSGTTVVARKRLSQKEEGDLTSQLKAEPKDPPKDEDDKARLSPFHPRARADYRFDSAPGPSEGLLTVKFAPVKADKKRMKGQAVVDARAGKVMTLRMSPSDMPPMLDELQMDFLAYAETPCEQQPTRMKIVGSGGVLLYKVRFRTEVTVTGHQKVDAPDPVTGAR
ncbi:hypothetical protein JRI60_02835 [Archangium violaceum]|uniref:hypothetical protein n=1 Tax=Archangium violaceum TaxID=83451 RepID=UPI00194FA0C9|nr:hypothetical protein [Archangium violaceum]QRN98027.1 hypothetical protein JRI60_02835 [Archangium violaceum]